MPEVLAERVCDDALLTMSRWSSADERDLYRSKIRALITEEMGRQPDPVPLYHRFLSRLLTLLDEAYEAGRV